MFKKQNLIKNHEILNLIAGLSSSWFTSTTNINTLMNWNTCRHLFQIGDRWYLRRSSFQLRKRFSYRLG